MAMKQRGQGFANGEEESKMFVQVIASRCFVQLCMSQAVPEGLATPADGRKLA